MFKTIEEMLDSIKMSKTIEESLDAIRIFCKDNNFDPGLARDMDLIDNMSDDEFIAYALKYTEYCQRFLIRPPTKYKKPDKFSYQLALRSTF